MFGRAPFSAIYKSAVLILLALLLSPSLVEAQSDTTRKRFLKWAYQDAADLARAIGPRAPVYLLGTAALLSQVSVYDQRVQYEVPGSYTGAFGTYLGITNELGGPKMNLPVAGIFAASLLTNDQRFQDAAFTSLQSMVYAGAISYGLKYAFGRYRPHDQNSPYRFSPMSGETSFPSGHTTTVFAVLTPWVLYYPHPVTYSLYALSTFGTAYSRIVREKHWVTDVLAGGALGFWTAYWLTKHHQGKTQKVAIMPMVSAQAVSVSVQVNL